MFQCASKFPMDAQLIKEMIRSLKSKDHFMCFVIFFLDKLWLFLCFHHEPTSSLIGQHPWFYGMHQGSRCILMAAKLLYPWSDIYGSDTLLRKIPNPVLASRSPSPEESIDRGSIDRGRFFFTLMWIATCHGCSSSVCAIFMISFLASHNQACLRYCNTTFCAPRVALPPA